MNRSILLKLRPYFLLAPVLFFLIAIFANGIALGFLQSLGYFPIIGLEKITLSYYKDVLSDPTVLKSLCFSLCISFSQAFISSILGVLFAYSLATTNRSNSRLIEFIYKIPIMLPHTVVALIIFLQFTQSGWTARMLFNLGIITDMGEFSTLVFDKFGIGIILTYVFKGLPFIALITIDIIKDSYYKYSKIARNLGANSRQVFIHVLIPLILPSALSGFIILFAFSFGAFEVPYLLGPSSPKALPVEAYIRYNSIDLSNRPNAMAINMIIAMCAFLLVIFYHFTLKILKRLFGGGSSE